MLATLNDTSHQHFCRVRIYGALANHSIVCTHIVLCACENLLSGVSWQNFCALSFTKLY